MQRGGPGRRWSRLLELLRRGRRLLYRVRLGFGGTKILDLNNGCKTGRQLSAVARHRAAVILLVHRPFYSSTRYPKRSHSSRGPSLTLIMAGSITVAAGTAASASLDQRRTGIATATLATRRDVLEGRQRTPVASAAALARTNDVDRHAVDLMVVSRGLAHENVAVLDL